MDQFESYVEGNCIIQKRTINFPKEIVFDAWINPHLLEKWYGPEGFTLTSLEVNIQAAGYWRFVFRSPDGNQFPNVIKFIEIEKPDYIIYDHTDDSGIKKPQHFRTEVKLEEEGEATKITMKLIFDSEQDLQYVVENFNALEGGRETLARLEHILKIKYK